MALANLGFLRILEERPEKALPLILLEKFRV
jgi:hypothetical protein